MRVHLGMRFACHPVLPAHFSSPWQMVWKHMEDQVAEKEEDADVVARQAEEEVLLRGGLDDYACELRGSLEGAHPSSIVCVRAWPRCDDVVTGSGEADENKS